jgi:hypothetical protein
MYLLGESWKVHIFHRMRKEAILLLHIQEKHLANYGQILSIISKQNKLIPKELRYQKKIHAIICYAKRKEKLCKFSPIFFFFIIKTNAIWTNIISRARSNLMMPIQKSSRSTCGSRLTDYVDFTFLSLPLTIVRINCTIVRVIEPHRLLVVLRNRISKGTYLT